MVFDLWSLIFDFLIGKIECSYKLKILMKEFLSKIKNQRSKIKFLIRFYGKRTGKTNGSF